MKATYRQHSINGKVVAEHRLLAEAALGHATPTGAEVHHVDENKYNNSPDNLVICPSRSYHQLLHKRTKAINACGHAHWLICRFCRAYDAPEIMSTNKANGQSYHKRCAAAAMLPKNRERRRLLIEARVARDLGLSGK